MRQPQQTGLSARGAFIFFALELWGGFSPSAGQAQAPARARAQIDRPGGGAPNEAAGGVMIVPAGDRLLVALTQPLNTRTTRKGTRVELKIAHDLFLGNDLALPRGATVRATVTESHRRRYVSVVDRPELRLRFDDLILPSGDAVPLAANIVRAGFLDLKKRRPNELEIRGEGPGKASAVLVAGSAARGAMVGGPVGAALFGTASLITVTQTRARDVGVPRGMVFEIELERDLEIGGPLSGLDEWYPSRAARLGSLEEPVPRRRPSAAPAARSAGTPAAAADGSSQPSAGGATASGFTLAIDVDLVTVEGVVRDGAGRVLDALAREDFRILEDGAEQPITHFSRGQLPLAVALVIDSSGSVSQYLPELRKAALGALGALAAEDQVALFAFSDNVTRLVNLTPDRSAIAARLAGIEPAGGTNIYDALFDAAQYLEVAAPGRRRAIILVSDNQATSLGRAGESAAVRMALEVQAVVYSIKTPGSLRAPAGARRKGVPAPGASVWLGDAESVSRITRDTGGEVLDLEKLGSLDDALAEVVTRLKLRYTLGYVPPRASVRDGRFHRLEVRLADRFGHPGEGYTVAARRGYYAK